MVTLASEGCYSEQRSHASGMHVPDELLRLTACDIEVSVRS